MRKKRLSDFLTKILIFKNSWALRNSGMYFSSNFVRI